MKSLIRKISVFMIVHLAWASQTSIMGKEPTFLYQGETNVSREYYAKLKTTPLDVVDKKPVYLSYIW